MELPWSNFLELHGDPRHNWELLCREVVRRHYERYGPLLTRKQQPGVEFHLKVQRDGGELGEPGRHWGWQCKWFEADAFRVDGNLRVDQRRSIEDAIAKSAKHLPTLTDWVLWTRDKLSANDQRWFEGLEAPFTLRQADEGTLAGMLTGPAEMLRQTWFGELVLDPATLGERWREALAPISKRYIGDLHVEVPAQHELADYLPGPELRDRLSRFQERLLRAEREVVQAVQGSINDSLEELGRDVVKVLAGAWERLGSLASILGAGELPRASEVEAVAGRRAELSALRSAVAQVIDRRHREAFAFGQADRALNAVENFLSHLANALRTPLLAVVGTAGAGKTHLAASLSGPEEQGRGVLILGRQFGAEIDDDDLARKAGIGPDREGLLEALEALGVREGRRVPLVIDGLNESRDPRSWQVTLARLAERLKHLPHVLVVVTLRPSYRGFALPEGVTTIEIPGFEGVEDEAVARYFDYYEIDADTAAIDWWRPSEPLLLSIFCQTVNPTRERPVGPSDLPGSLHEVFEHYLKGLLRRVAHALRADPRTVERALVRLAQRFFAEGERELDVELVAEILEDDRWEEWEHTLRFQLEAEGLLQRDVIGTAEALNWSYDLLGGHLIAKAILERHPKRAQIADQGTVNALAAHPLREDVIVGLSGLLASEGEELAAIFAQVEPLSAEATLASARLAASEVGEAAVGSMIRLFASQPNAVLDAISPLAFRTGHPLNGRLLDVLLGQMETWERDLVWTEWFRRRTETIEAQLSELTRRWRGGQLEQDEDAPLAWATWLLTTTDKRLRDEATYGLYEFGRRNPRRLFSRALELLSVSDPAVAEGLLAASYGTAMSMQAGSAEEQSAVIEFAGDLERLLLSEGASQPTCHWLVREYAYRTTQLAAWLSEGEFPARPDAPQPLFPEPSDQLDPFTPGDEGWEAVTGAFGMDFSNYTIGRLIEDRLPDQDGNPRFLTVTGEIRARVADLGWTRERFGEIDREIASTSFGRQGDPMKVERYGKKYSWVGFYEAAGRLSDRRELRLDEHIHEDWRISDVPIDPSFPQTIHTEPPQVAEWVPVDGDDEAWVRNGHSDLPDELLRREEDGTSWIVVDGHLTRQPADTGRRVFCSIRGLLALDGWGSVASHFAEEGLSPEAIPANSGGYYYFAGEAPWAPTFDSHATEHDGRSEPEVTMLGRLGNGPGIELLAVDFSWESYHSALNDAQIGSLPSKAFSRFAGLRKLAGAAEFVDSNGQLAARSMAVRGGGWSGELLLIRQDLVEAYSTERGGEWGWALWGLRELIRAGLTDRPPDWLSKARLQREDFFSRVVSLAELGPA